MGVVPHLLFRSGIYWFPIFSLGDGLTYKTRQPVDTTLVASSPATYYNSMETSPAPQTTAQSSPPSNPTPEKMTETVVKYAFSVAADF